MPGNTLGTNGGVTGAQRLCGVTAGEAVGRDPNDRWLVPSHHGVSYKLWCPLPCPPPTHCPAASRGRVIPGGRIEPRLSSAQGPIRVHVMLGSVSLGALYSGPIPTPQGQMPAVWDMPVVPSAGDRGTGLCTQGAPRSGCEVPPASLGTLRGLASASFSLKLKKNNPKQGVRVTECV